MGNRRPPPPWISDEGHSEWDRLLDLYPHLDQRLSDRDRQLLAILSTHVATSRDIAKELNVDLALVVSSPASLNKEKRR